VRRIVIMVLLVTFTVQASAVRTIFAEADPPAEVRVGEPGFHFFSGEEVEKTIIVRTSGLKQPRANLAFNWRLLIGPAVCQRGRFDLTVGEPEFRRRIVLQMPEVQRVMQGSLHLSLQQQDNPAASRSYRILLFPRQPSVPSILKHKEIALLDPVGKTAAALDYLGIKYVSMPRPGWWTGGLPDLVILGRDIPARSLPSFLAELRDTVKKGSSVLCLAQSHLDLVVMHLVSICFGEATKKRWGSCEILRCSN